MNSIEVGDINYIFITSQLCKWLSTPWSIRAQLEPVFPGRTLVLYWWGPLVVGIIWRKKILPPAHKGFSEARGLDLDLWTELTGNGGGIGTGAWAPFAMLSPQPLPCSRDQPLSCGYHWNSWLSVSCGSVPFQDWTFQVWQENWC